VLCDPVGSHENIGARVGCHQSFPFRSELPILSSYAFGERLVRSR
jgi:hypothetical protein